jgi:DNA-binding LacI/PurR family transcriptional regulator
MANSVPTLEDVANLAGVSKSTASRILATRIDPGKKIPFASETQDKVFAAVAKLGYKPSKLARGLTMAKTGIIGLVIPSLTDSFFPHVTSAIETRLTEAGYSVILVNTNSSSKVELSRVEDLLSWQVDGLIIAAAQESGEAGLFWDLWRRDIPFVLIDRTFSDTPFYSVTTDDTVGATLAVEHLLANGCRRIARVCGSPMSVSTNQQRQAGYLSALMRQGIVPHESSMIDVVHYQEEGRQLLDRLLSLDPRPDGVFCFSDITAIDIIEACGQYGIRVPEELAVVGYSDLPQSRLLKISLTTIRQPRSLLGRNAAEMLLARMEQKEQPVQINLPVELVVRQSTMGKRALEISPKNGDSLPVAAKQ